MHVKGNKKSVSDYVSNKRVNKGKCGPTAERGGYLSDSRHRGRAELP